WGDAGISLCYSLGLCTVRACWHPHGATCVCFFFFSSRRRHTRFKCDWSSDVCSSDLAGPVGSRWPITSAGTSASSASPPWRRNRSEERRVGKEWRSRWSADDEKKEEEPQEKSRRTHHSVAAASHMIYAMFYSTYENTL